MPHVRPLLLLACCLLLASCLSTAVGVTAGTVKAAVSAATLPVKAGVAVVKAAGDEEEKEKRKED